MAWDRQQAQCMRRLNAERLGKRFQKTAESGLLVPRTRGADLLVFSALHTLKSLTVTGPSLPLILSK